MDAAFLCGMHVKQPNSNANIKHHRLCIPFSFYIFCFAVAAQ